MKRKRQYRTKHKELTKTSIASFIRRNKEIITLSSTFMIGFATIVTSIISAYLAYEQNEITREQNDIYREQNDYQKKLIQPVFNIRIRKANLKDSTIPDTEYLEIRNVGSKTISYDMLCICLFHLKRISLGSQSEVYVNLANYFKKHSHDTKENETIDLFGLEGNKSVFEKCCKEAYLDSKKGKEGIYILERLPLIKISYTDILGDERNLYYLDKKKITKEEYNQFFYPENNKLPIPINNISYSYLKKALEEQM